MRRDQPLQDGTALLQEIREKRRNVYLTEDENALEISCDSGKPRNGDWLDLPAWDGGFMEKSPRKKKKGAGIPVRLYLLALLAAAGVGTGSAAGTAGALRASAMENAADETTADESEAETESEKGIADETFTDASETKTESEKGIAGETTVDASETETEPEKGIAGETAAGDASGTETETEEGTAGEAAETSALSVPDFLGLQIAQMIGIETEAETETENETETEIDLTDEIHRAVRSQIWEIQMGSEFQIPMAASETDQRPALPVVWSCGRLFTWYSGGLYPWQQERSMERLEQLVRATVEDYDGSWSVYVKNLDTDESFVINDEPMKSASVMKLFIMGTVYAAFDEGELERTDEIMSLMNLMISNSDNTASNQLLYILGDSSYADGIAKVNEFIQSHGYSEMTVEYNGFSNSATNSGEGINQVAAKDVGALLEDIYRRTWMNRADSNEMEEMLLAQNTRYKIPAGLPDGVLCGNKSGEMSDTQNDAAIIYSDGCDYILVVLSNGWSSSDTAIQRIKNISALVYEYFN
ncbi:MAG: serine hydrolase [Lachnospiraceae bacterium]|nr:serine hydrolase [Lachnospiraceae bacterium]